jgi:hypothetical protein
MTNQIDFTIPKTPAQIIQEVLPVMQREGIDLFELARISERLKELTGSTCDGRTIINTLAMFDVAFHLIGDKLLPYPMGEKPTIVVPPVFADTTMQFHSHLLKVRREESMRLYFPTLDMESGLDSVLVKQGVWLKNYNDNFLYALLQKFAISHRELLEHGDVSGRTTLWMPVVRLDSDSIPTLSLLHCRGSLLDDLTIPFANVWVRSGSTIQFSGDGVTNETELSECRSAVRNGLPWFEALRSFFDPANNPIPHERAKTLRELLIASNTANPGSIRAVMSNPNRNLH